ncbi:MAG: hypothetical protein OXD50_14190 [Chloroflexi bacterium]|nr:hypothetical protein [Chloroflexota bacterium]
MAIIDKLKFRNILVNGDIAEEAPAEEFVAALDETFEEQLSGLVTKEDLALQTSDLNARFAEVDARFAKVDTQFAEVKAQMAALETRMTRSIMWTAFGLLAALTAIMTLLQVLLD